MPNKFERYRWEIPELVRQAISLAEELGFPLMPEAEGRPADYQGPPSACIPEVGRFLSVLAAGYPYGKIAEFGTGAGVGTAWLIHGLPGTSKLFSAEMDETLATQTRALFAQYPNVQIRQVLKPENWDQFIEMVRIGGKIVFDDLLPIESWPPDWDDLVDAKREFVHRNRRIIGTEIRTTASQVAIIATRIS